MARAEFLMPKMGESITEATILKWAKKEGDWIDEDETLAEIATDKVDSELPSPFSGKIISLLYDEGATVPVGLPIAIIESEMPLVDNKAVDEEISKITTGDGESKIIKTKEARSIKSQLEKPVRTAARPSSANRFYSPLIRNIAELEQLTISELNQIKGSGQDDRVTKKDIVEYLKIKNKRINKEEINYKPYHKSDNITPRSYRGETEIIEMDRTRRMIADHMVRSKHTSPHVTSFLEIDVTEIVNWRNRVKVNFQKKYNQKLTFTPIFIEAITKAIKDFPEINASVDGNSIVLKKYVNIGMATATANGNLVVPVLKNTDQLDLCGLAMSVNDLGERARVGKLVPDEVQNGTFTLTNVGTFGNTMGTPIINQPQVAILSVGAIRKKPAVVEAVNGDRIEIRNMMFLSLSYDHRVVDGALGGKFLRRVGDYLEKFDYRSI